MEDNCIYVGLGNYKKDSPSAVEVHPETLLNFGQSGNPSLLLIIVNDLGSKDFGFFKFLAE